MIRPPWLTTEPYVVIDLGTLGGGSLASLIFLLQIRTVVVCVLSGTLIASA
jgi:bacteriorhodopsin